MIDKLFKELFVNKRFASVLEICEFMSSTGMADYGSIRDAIMNPLTDDIRKRRAVLLMLKLMVDMPNRKLDRGPLLLMITNGLADLPLQP